MIQAAREADIHEFIETDKRGFTHCLNPDHHDKNPSMHVNNGFVYCFSCGWSGDVIDVVMAKENLTFTEAVKFITGAK
jgi:DNA primase